MQDQHEIIEAVYAAKEDAQKADELIRAYIPFIRAETSKFLSRFCTEQDDEFSVAMIAFHEAIGSYKKERGAFLGYASMLICSRLIDYSRKEARHRGHISLEEETGEEGRPLLEQVADSRDAYAEHTGLTATRQEIEELGAVLSDFGVSFTDIAENSPKQERTLAACARVVQHAVENTALLDTLLETKKLPLAALSAGASVERKTLERHRKYILAMLLIQTNGYEIIRGHVKHVLKPKGGVPV